MCGLKERHWVQDSWGRKDLGDLANCNETLFSVVP